MRVQMSVIKVEIRLREIPAAIEVFKNNRKKALDLFQRRFAGQSAMVLISF